MAEAEKYRPSNGTEGMIFEGKFCSNCIHGKYEHTQDDNDNPCDILSSAFLFDINDDAYPEEWIYDEKGEPTCTAFKKWDWLQRPEGPDAPPPIPPDPRQLKIPFEGDENIVANGNEHT